MLDEAVLWVGQTIEARRYVYGKHGQIERDRFHDLTRSDITVEQIAALPYDETAVFSDD